MDGEDSCAKCCNLQNELQKKMMVMEQNNSQHLTAFLTLKQKIVATDQLICEYQSVKTECEILTRKNEEFSRLIDQLHQDLNTRNQEYSVMLAEIEPLKKANEEYRAQFVGLEEEAQKWKYEFEAGQKYTKQLAEKVKLLEKFEEEWKDKSKDYERMETKLETLKGQYKEAKESGNDARKELKKFQKDHAQVVKHALLWGKVAAAQGKLPAAQKRFYTKLQAGDVGNVEEAEAGEEEEEENGEFSPEETDEQSKLLEQLLCEGDGATDVTEMESNATEAGGRQKKGRGRKGKESSTSQRQGEASSAGRAAKSGGMKGLRAQSKLLEELLNQEDGETAEESEMESVSDNGKKKEGSRSSPVKNGRSGEMPILDHLQTPSRSTRSRSRSQSSTPSANRQVAAEGPERPFASPKEVNRRMTPRRNMPDLLGSDSESAEGKRNESGPRTRSRSGQAAPPQSPSASLTDAKTVATKKGRSQLSSPCAVLGIAPLPPEKESVFISLDSELDQLEAGRQEVAGAATQPQPVLEQENLCSSSFLMADLDLSSESSSSVESSAQPNPPASSTGDAAESISEMVQSNPLVEVISDVSISHLTDLTLPSRLTSNDLSSSSSDEAEFECVPEKAPPKLTETTASSVLGEADLPYDVSSNDIIQSESTGSGVSSAVEETDQEESPQNQVEALPVKDSDPMPALVDSVSPAEEQTEDHTTDDGILSSKEESKEDNTGTEETSTEVLADAGQSGKVSEPTESLPQPDVLDPVPSTVQSPPSTEEGGARSDVEPAEKIEALVPSDGLSSLSSPKVDADLDAAKSAVGEAITVESHSGMPEGGTMLSVVDLIPSCKSPIEASIEPTIGNEGVPSQLPISVTEPETSVEADFHAESKGQPVPLESTVEQAVDSSPITATVSEPAAAEIQPPPVAEIQPPPEHASTSHGQGDERKLIDKNVTQKSDLNRPSSVPGTLRCEVVHEETPRVSSGREAGSPKHARNSQPLPTAELTDPTTSGKGEPPHPIETSDASTKSLFDLDSTNDLEYSKGQSSVERQPSFEQEAHPPSNEDPKKVKQIAFQPGGLLQNPTKPVAAPPPSRPSEPTFKVPAVPVRNAVDSGSFVKPRSGAAFNIHDDDEEVADILEAIRLTISNVPRALSPLPGSPVPSRMADVPAVASAATLLVPKKEPKFSFPSLPRCAFNWAPKKLPIDNQLNEKLGGIHSGINARVRFRRVGAVGSSIRSPDIRCRIYQGVVNYAEAERRPKPLVVAPAVQPQPSFIPAVSSLRDDIPTGAANSGKVPEFTRPSVKRSATKPQGEPAGRVPEIHPEFVKRTPEPPKRPILPSVYSVPEDAGTGKSEKRPTLIPPFAHPITKGVAKSPSEPASRLLESVSEPKTRLALSTSATKRSVADLFGDASSSDSEPESGVKESPFKKPSAEKRKPETFLPPKAPAFPLRREGLNRLPFKSAEPTFTVTRPVIAPCSEALLNKAKTQPRIVAPAVTRPNRQPPPTNPSPVEPVIQLVDEFIPPQDVQQKKRVSHANKRSLEADGSDPSPLVAPTKKARTVPPIVQPFPSVPPATRTPLKQNVVVQPENRIHPIVPARGKQIKTTEAPKLEEPRKIVSSASLPSESESASETDVESPSSVAPSPPSPPKAVLPDENEACSADAEKTVDMDAPQSAEGVVKAVEEQSPEPPEEERFEPPTQVVEPEDPTSPGEKESPQSPIPATEFESPESPDDSQRMSTHTDIPEIPADLNHPQEESISAFELATKLLASQPKTPEKIKPNAKIRKVVNLSVNKFIKSQEITVELLSSTAQRLLRPDPNRNACVVIRQLIALVLKDCDAALDLSMTPPAPPLVPTQQRCIVLLKAVDEKYAEMKPENGPHFFSDAFLSELSSVMFQPKSTLTLEQMSALARTYTALCRSRGLMSRARSFLLDCFYFYPPRSYALTYTIITVWGEILRPVSFPTGLTVVDQTISYLLLHCTKVVAVPGVAGKVLQVRSFLQNALEYKSITTGGTADDLVSFLVSRLSETKSVDEAVSLSWSLALLVRWEGPDLAISIIEKQLWPFLQKWSAGHGTNVGAASAISCIGTLGKIIPVNKRTGLKTVLEAMKTLLKSEDADDLIQEAAVEAVILLGEDDEPDAVIDVLKEWTPRKRPSLELQKILQSFVSRNSRKDSTEVPLVTNCSETEGE